MTTHVVLVDANLLQLSEVGRYMGEWDTDLNEVVKEWLDEQDIVVELTDHCAVVLDRAFRAKARIRSGYLLRMSTFNGKITNGFRVVNFEHVYQAALFRLRWL